MNYVNPERDFILKCSNLVTEWGLRLLAILLLGLFVIPAHAIDTVSIKGDVTGLSLGTYLEYLEDEKGEITIDDLLTDGHFSFPWKKSMKSVPGFGFTATPYWFTVKIKSEDVSPDEFLLEIGTSVLDRIEAYYVSNGAVNNIYTTGDHYPFSDRPISHRNFLFPLEITPGETVQIYLRVETSTALQLPLSLWSKKAFYKQDVSNTYAHGLFYGIMLVVMLFSLFIYFSIRERQYIYYSLYVLFHTAFQAAVHGATFQYLWPNSIWWHEQSIAVFSGAAIVFSCLFAIDFLSLRESKRKLYLSLMVVAVASAIAVAATLVVPYSIIIRVIIPLALLMVVGFFVSGIIRWREGDKPAQVYTIAWASFLFGIVLLTLNRMDIIPRNMFTENAMQVGASIEVILLLIAMTQRLSLEIKERFRIQEAALIEHQNANLVLESRVEERTTELAGKNKQLEAISIKLAKYLSPQIYEQIFQGKWDVRLETRRRKLTIFFSDIKDFTEITDSMESEALTELLNSYLNEMAEVALSYGGTIDKFIGDGVMVFFGDPESQGDKQDALNCVMMSLEMRKRMVDLRAKWMSEGVTSALQIRIGINTGYCTVGN
ncbi:MAG: hypothetical protein KAJ95_11075, partial [Gammaproteobacteria bacterium]|nr:hypothetical protein [Gammaproteobacteria bacterium]